MTTALLFPGQGSQTVGMSKALADAFPAAREVFARVDAALGEALSKTIFEGPEGTFSQEVPCSDTPSHSRQVLCRRVPPMTR